MHALVHLLALVLIVGPVRNLILPQLLTLAAVHFLIDWSKMLLGRFRPKWIIAPYVVDQVMHILSLIAISIWIDRSIDPADTPTNGILVLYAAGYVLATHVWQISEQVMFYADRAYRQATDRQAWFRMFARGLLLSAFLAVPFLLGAREFAAGASIPYLAGAYRKRTLFTDVGVALIVAVGIQLLT